MPSAPVPANGVPGRAAVHPYDPSAVASAARAHDPGLPPETAELLARQAADHLADMGALDAPELARRLMRNADVGASPASVVAAAAVAHCQGPG